MSSLHVSKTNCSSPTIFEGLQFGLDLGSCAHLMLMKEHESVNQTMPKKTQRAPAYLDLKAMDGLDLQSMNEFEEALMLDCLLLTISPMKCVFLLLFPSCGEFFVVCVERLTQIVVISIYRTRL